MSKKNRYKKWNITLMAWFPKAKHKLTRENKDIDNNNKHKPKGKR